MRRRSNPDSEPNIRRIDTKARAKKQTHGFQVHFLRGKESVTRMFSDSLYGGEGGGGRGAPHESLSGQRSGERPNAAQDRHRAGGGGASPFFHARVSSIRQTLTRI